VSVKELCQEIEARRTEQLSREATIHPRNQPVASDLGPCDRELVLQIVAWDQKPPFDPYVMARLKRGSAIEDIVIRELSSLGIYVRVDRKPFELKDRQGRVILRGKVDGFIEQKEEIPEMSMIPLAKGEAPTVPPKSTTKVYPFEAKSMNPNIFNGVHKIEDLKGYFAKWPLQLQSYLFGNDLEEGLLLIDDCMGHWKLLPVTLDYKVMEGILQRCENTMDMVKRVQGVTDFQAGTMSTQGMDEKIHKILPPYHHDLAVCVRCWARGRVCFPPMDRKGLQELKPEDEERLVPILDRRGELEEARTEYEAADREAKKALKGLDQAVVGKWLVQGKEILGQRKAQEAKETTTWRTTITKIE